MDSFSNLSIPQNATSPVKEFWECVIIIFIIIIIIIIIIILY